MEHVFLTGAIQVGKSTILNKYLRAHPELRVGGFRTVWKGRWSERASIHIVPAAEDVPLTEENCVGIRSFVPPRRGREDYPKIYDTVGVPILEGGGPYDLYLMDEIGPGENEAAEFRKAVLRLLDGDTPVLGVVQEKPGVLPDLIRAHERVRIITVTEENRDDIRIEDLLGSD